MSTWALDIAFTGTQYGQREAQYYAVRSLLYSKVAESPVVADNPTGRLYRAHLGDCIGADKQCYLITTRMNNWWRVGHPPIIPDKRAFCEYDEERPLKGYIPRNHDMVDEAMELIATPKEFREVERYSGTWATIRYCLYKVFKPVTIVWPDGTLLEILDPSRAVGKGLINSSWRF